MYVSLPEGLQEIPVEEFEELIENINWKRDSIGNLDRYFDIGRNRYFGWKDISKGTFHVDPKFFQPA